jgi:uncharacterized cupin superfamily protein
VLRPRELADAGTPQPRRLRGDDYGLEGTTTWTINGETVEVGPGEAVCVPRGQIHGFQNPGSVDAKILCIAAPAVFGPAYFREIGEVLAASAGGRRISPRSAR